ncbi:MAG TPA: hypothetical protein PKD64_04725 [Pirellulaceae bacterium]|nr:hypothetical protein [Pirellulaceae bacterium]HMO91478.1 hypothetical protein [Pirellulaceae bacterium]HMP70991.1 hypothetical protein [Pirellulaceae bacterium]
MHRRLLKFGMIFCNSLALLLGCGTTTQKIALEQLLISDAVDKAIAHIDFSPLDGKSVFLDTSYLNQVNGVAWVNSSYVISAIRQELNAHQCTIQTDINLAEIVIEPRLGALGTNGHDVIYGIPASSNNLGAAAGAFGVTPAPVIIPELAFAKADLLVGVAKLAIFAYERETREGLWQSGISVAESRNLNAWILGAGPIQKGSLYGEVRFTSSPFRIARAGKEDAVLKSNHSYFNARVFETRSANTTEVARNDESDADKPAEKNEEGETIIR